MARTTVDKTIQRIRRQLSSSFRYETNVLAGDIAYDDTELTLTWDLSANVIPGSVLNIGVEIMRVMAVNRTTKTVTVIRGWQDSIAAPHLLGDEVWVNPRFGAQDIFDAIVDEVGSYGPQLYRVDGQTLSVALDAVTVELPAAWVGCYGICDIRIQGDDDWWARARARLIRGILGQFDGATTSGLLIRLIDKPPATSLYVTVALPFDLENIDTTSDLVNDIGLPATMLDVVAMGVKIRLLSDAENDRSGRSVQDDPRRAEEVPLGGTVPVQQVNVALYRSRRQEEVNKLQTAYPVVLR